MNSDNDTDNSHDKDDDHDNNGTNSIIVFLPFQIWFRFSHERIAVSCWCVFYTIEQNGKTHKNPFFIQVTLSVRPSLHPFLFQPYPAL